MSQSGEQEAKRCSMDAHFRDVQARVAFTLELYRQGHRLEAGILCCCYIEALGNRIHGDGRVGAKEFTNVLAQHGGEPALALIVPLALERDLPFKSAAPAVRDEVKSALASLPRDRAFELAEIRRQLFPLLSPSATKFLEPELWRGMVANIAYSRFRTPGVHWAGAPDAVIIDRVDGAGEAVPEVNFQILHRALIRIVDHARSISLSSGKWFGIE